MLRRWIKKLGVVVAATAALAIVTPTSPAVAGTCTTKYCGGIMTNSSSGSIGGLFFVSNNWCWSNRSEWYGSTLPCATKWSAYAYNSYFMLGHPDTTSNYPYYYDTDAFRIDPGCQLNASDGTIYRNYDTTTPLWRKINNLSDIRITGVIC